MGSSGLLVLLIVFMGVMLFVSSRQRRKQQQQQDQLQNSIAVGDVVVMTSGISGTVVDVDDEKTIDLEIAPDVITTWLRAAVREKLTADAGDDTATEHDEQPATEQAAISDDHDGVGATASGTPAAPGAAAGPVDASSGAAERNGSEASGPRTS